VLQKYRLVAPALALLFAAAQFVVPARAEEPAKQVPSQNVGGVEDSKDTGSIHGVVLFKGTKPELKPISDIAGNAFCHERHKDEVPVRQTFLFGKNGDNDTLQNVLVYVSKGAEDKEFPISKTPVVLDQVGCMYRPHVVAVMAGQTLQIRNSDATLHNVMCSPRDNPAFNIGMPVPGGTYDFVFKIPEMKMNTKCFMHPWMSGYIHVLENPFFAVTGPDGTFTIKGLPPGEYEISVLHEASLMEPTPATATVTVAASENKQVNFTYAVKPEPK
jgi:plastocyanin